MVSSVGMVTLVWLRSGYIVIEAKGHGSLVSLGLQPMVIRRRQVPGLVRGSQGI